MRGALYTCALLLLLLLLLLLPAACQALAQGDMLSLKGE
jgi:hypothetical protein